jgi:hypothetical protein
MQATATRVSQLLNPKLDHREKLLEVYNKLLSAFLASKSRYEKRVASYSYTIANEETTFAQIISHIPEEKSESFATQFDIFLSADDWNIVPQKKPKLIVIQGTGSSIELVNQLAAKSQQINWRNLSLLQLYQLRKTQEQKLQALESFLLSLRNLPEGYDPDGTLQSLESQTKNCIANLAVVKIHKAFTEKLLSSQPSYALPSLSKISSSKDQTTSEEKTAAHKKETKKKPASAKKNVSFSKDTSSSRSSNGSVSAPSSTSSTSSSSNSSSTSKKNVSGKNRSRTASTGASRPTTRAMSSGSTKRKN